MKTDNLKHFNKMNFLKKHSIAILLLLIGISGCQDPWADRIEVKEDVPKNNLMEEIISKTELSEFVKILQSTGWDSILTSTKPNSIWAPTNEALKAVSDDILNDPEKLKELVDNHICFLQHKYFSQIGTKRIKTYRGKYLNLDFNNGKANDANLSKPFDIVANNGVLHIIDKALVPQMNIWEFIESTDQCPKLVEYLKSLTGTIFDPTIATQIGVDPLSGKPIYDTITGLLWNNSFLNKTRDLRNEDSLSTLILFADQDYTSEFSKFRPYFTYNDKINNYEVLSDSVTNWKISKDIVFEGAISPEELPAELTSTFGVNVPIGSFNIESNFQASNGMVYIVSNYSIEKPDKIPVIILQGEDTTKYVGRDPFGQSGFTRQVELASGGYDFVLDNHGGNPGTLTFYVPDLCNSVYKVYWRAIDDFNYSYKYPSTDTISQSLGWVIQNGTENGIPVFDDFNNIGNSVFVIDSSYTTAQDVFIYDANVEGYTDRKWIQLKGEGKNTPLTLDYIKIVPVFND
jgi:uncharacterized surface protein with fasciclin (FAS1) repeats